MSQTEELFLLAGTWTLVAVFIARFIPSWPGRIAFFVLGVGLPFWELPYGYYNFQQLCRENLDLKVVEKIAPQESVCADHPYVTLHNELLRSGFKVVETRDKAGEIRKFVVHAGGKVEETKQKELVSRYCLTFTSNIRLPWRIQRHDQLVVRAHDRSIVASQSDFSWAGMWWQESVRPVFGRGGDCSDSKNRSILALRYGAS